MGSEENIFLFIPNIIGYIRIGLALTAFFFMPTNHVIASWCYIISGLLDAMDGYLARIFNQNSKFGALLDMLTDRCATMCLLVVLSTFYPRLIFIFQLIMIIDISSHWIHCQSAYMKGAESHKIIDLSGNYILRHYYTNKIVLFVMCSGNELFFSMLYLIYFTPGPIIPLGPASIGIFTLTLVLTLPISLAKNSISLVQLYAACQNVAAIDIADRKKSMVEKKVY